MPIRRFEYRKQIFDYLKTIFTDVELVVEHPTGVTTNPKIVVTPISDSAQGMYESPNIENPDIKICMYANRELILTKPTGLINTLEEGMKLFCPDPECNFRKVNSVDVAYFDDLNLYFSWSTYRFFTSQA